MYISIYDIKYILKTLRDSINKGTTQTELRKCYMILNTNFFIYENKKKGKKL